MLLLLVSSLVVLAFWTFQDPLQWERFVIDPDTGDSIGHCACENELAYLGPLVALILIPLFLTAIMARKTSDVDDAYSEGHWIYVLLVIQLEAIIVALPVVSLLRDVSTNARYFGFVVMLWVFPMSTLGVIIAPKVINCLRDVYGCKKSSGRRGEQTREVRVSGVHIQEETDVSPAINASQMSSTVERSREMSVLSGHGSFVTNGSIIVNEPSQTDHA
jgi:hypothetical protein